MQRWFLLESPQHKKIEKSAETDTMGEQISESITPLEEPLQRTFSVVVSDMEPREAVFVSGDAAELGEWNYERMVALVPQGANLWSVRLDFDLDSDVLFRYCIAVVMDAQVSIRRWETNIHPRKITAGSQSTEEHIFGEYDGKTTISRGWVTVDTLLQFKFFEQSLKLRSSHLSGLTLLVKVTPMSSTPNGEVAYGGCGDDASGSNDTGETSEVSGLRVETAVLNAKSCEPRLQAQFGCVYRPHDLLAVNVWGVGTDQLAYLVDLYAQGAEQVPTHVGSAYVVPELLRGSEGRLELPLLCHVKRRPLGTVQVEYLVVRPMPEPLCDLSVSYAKHWDSNWTGLEVGHRGLGASFKTKEGNEIRENTIASLKRAAASGADLLEFDVQLSKDMVPVIYHDFYVCISMKRKKQVDYTEMLELPVKDLSLDQLQKLKVYHLVEGRNNETRFFDDELEEHQPFPTLEQVLAAIDPHVGFNVELKWNMELMDGTFELNNPFDMNTYVDKVLEVLLKYGGERRIVLSGFNPDICTMLRYKQNKYPVMFLTQGQTERYPRYRDERCVSVLAAVRHAVSTDILGVVAHTEDLLRDPSQVKLAQDAGLVIFCWGDDNNNKETIQKLKDMGLHAVIYDKLDQYTTKEVKESIFLVEARESQKELLRVANNDDTQSTFESQQSTESDAVRRMDAAVRASHASASTATACIIQTDRGIKRSKLLIAGSDKELQHKKQSGSFLSAFPTSSKRNRSAAGENQE